MGKDQLNWDVYLHDLRFAYNSAVNSTTKVSPIFLIFGRELRSKVSFRVEEEGSSEIPESEREWWVQRMERLQELRDIVTLHLEDAHEKQTRYYNK